MELVQNRWYHTSFLLFRLIVMELMIGFYLTSEITELEMLQIKVIMFALGLLNLYHLIPSRTWNIGSFVVEILLIMPLAIQFSDSYDTFHLLIGLTGFQIFYHRPERFAIYLYLISLVLSQCYLIGKDTLTHEFSLLSYMINASFILFASLMGYLLRSHQIARIEIRSLYDQLKESHQHLERYALEVEKIATQNERVRIAREIHDAVGHYMTALILQLQVARKMQQTHPEKSEQFLLSSEELARTALQEIRLSVQTLKEGEVESVPFTELLEKITTDFNKWSETKYFLQIVGEEPKDFSNKWKMHLFRIVQEAITNANKHGKATQINLKLSYKKDEFQLVVSDNGVGQTWIQLGFGLSQIEARVKEINGKLKIDSRAGEGFHLVIQIPYSTTNSYRSDHDVETTHRR